MRSSGHPSITPKKEFLNNMKRFKWELITTLFWFICINHNRIICQDAAETLSKQVKFLLWLGEAW